MALRKRIRAVSGGTGASKTIGIVQILIDKSQSDALPKKTSIVSESFPHLEKGVIEDFKNIMQQHGYWNDARWNETKHTYLFETGSKIEFFSADQWERVKGPRRDRLYINEANNVSFASFEQLEFRTNEEIWLDWNPSSEFWFYTDVLNSESYKGVIDFITLTYLDNEGLPQTIRDSIERRRYRKDWWKVYGQGQLGEIEGRIYVGWEIIDEVPHNARLVCRWLDFGYANDPTSIGDIYYYNGGYIVDEQLYQKGMLNKPLADFLSNLTIPQTIVVADSAEPKSIDEIKLCGVNIIGVQKNRGDTKSDTFVKWSIGLVQDQKVSVTKRSVNTIKEYRNYLWLVDKDGKILNEEDPKCANHSMAGIRYGMVYLLGKRPRPVTPAPSQPMKPYYGDQDIAF